MSQESNAAPTTTRRDVLRTGSAAAVGALVSAPAIHAHGRRQDDNADTLKVGLIGCGGRGTGAAAQALAADPNTKLVALADAFSDQLENSLRTLQNNAGIAEQVAVDPEHCFTGFDGYKGVIESCDVVLFATSPHFRPLQVRAAVEAGRHLFVEKPVAVDAPGLRHIWRSCEMAAEKGLSLVSGLCYRYQFAKQETLARVHAGDIGDITALQCTYNTGALWHRGTHPDWTPMEYQMRNWLYHTWLSGDHIAEQHIHSLDKILWAMGDVAPESCTASGGRIVRTDEKYGDAYDHFNTTYEWAGGVRGFSSCRQWAGAASNVSDYAFGTQGTAALQHHRIEGEKSWRFRKADGVVDDMYQNEHDALFASIRSGEPINNGDYMCKSTLMAIMGRMAAYTGQKVTWQQALNSELDLTPASYAFGDAPAVEIARPGITKFV